MSSNDNNNDEKEKTSDETTRRRFLALGAGAVLSSSSLNACGTDQKERGIQVSESQRAYKRKTPSRVSLDKTTYDELLPVLERNWKLLGPDIKGKKIFLKVNLVDWRPDKPLCTDPRFVDAVIQLMQKNGAAVIKVGDGPAITRDTERLVQKSGIEAVMKKHGMKFVDLNIDDLVEVTNPLKFTGEDKFLLPQSVTTSDMLISLPKLKTHHWALMTASMKNLFGVLPGRKYGWPKNILHIKGIDKSIVDLVSAIKPQFAIVDGIVAMEGDGPLNGTGLDFGALIMGDDVVAVDTVCGSCMKLPVAVIPYLKIAGMCIGNADLNQIEILGKTVADMQRNFEFPPTFEPDGRPRNLTNLKTGSDGGLT